MDEYPEQRSAEPMDNLPETTPTSEETTAGQPPVSSYPRFSSPAVRVLGCLMEKQVTVPDQYPLSLNALVNACNQKSSRDPVTSYTEQEVVKALEELREQGFASLVSTADGRVPKYRHRIEDRLSMGPSSRSLLCVMLLRGPQTLGELRTRTERMHRFTDLQAVMTAMEHLLHYPQSPLAVMLPREAGRKDNRYLHTLGLETSAGTAGPEPQAQFQSPVSDEPDRFIELEGEVKRLATELEALAEEFRRFKAGFE